MRKFGVKIKFFAVLFSVFAIGTSLHSAYYPEIGRFISRDPIEERGFQANAQATGSVELLNALVNKKFEPEYTFVKNDPVNSWDLLGLEWQVERDPNFEWAQVIRTDPYRDTAEKLAQIIKLNSTQAFGENGWLKKRKGAVTNLETFDHEDKKTCQFAVPNVFTVQVGSQSGAAANEIKGLADNLLRQKGFFINGNGIGSSTYGVLYIGHFYGGTFSSNGDTGDIDSNTILNLTGGLRQIAYFGGFGCFTINHDWRRAVAFPSMDITLWQTNYGLTPSLFYLSKLDTKPRKNKFDIEAERQIGSDGPSLNSWINQIHGN